MTLSDKQRWSSITRNPFAPVATQAVIDAVEAAFVEALGDGWETTYKSEKLLKVAKGPATVEAQVFTRGGDPYVEVYGRLGRNRIWTRRFSIQTEPGYIARTVKRSALPEMRDAWKRRQQAKAKRQREAEMQRKAQRLMREGRFPKKQVVRWRNVSSDHEAWEKVIVSVPDWDAFREMEAE